MRAVLAHEFLAADGVPVLYRALAGETLRDAARTIGVEERYIREWQDDGVLVGPKADRCARPFGQWVRA